jgi:uncharacterized protein (TIGR01777 family)
MASTGLGTVVIGGGTGFIGRSLVAALRDIGSQVYVVSRMPGPQTLSWGDVAKDGLPQGTSVVINVAGQNVLDPMRRWTPGFQQNVYSSRINTTKFLASAIERSDSPPKVFVTISGVGFYEASPSQEYTEDMTGGDDFFARLCKEWEAAAQLDPSVSTRRVTIRSGIVLGNSGGLIQQIYLPFFLGLGGKMASGLQPMPWIHIEDMVRLFMFAVEEEKVEGPVNGVAPQLVTNLEFTKALGRAFWRPTVIPLPESIIRLAFGPERAAMMTTGQKVIPAKAQRLGFTYNYPDINSACRDVVNWSS